MPRYRIHPTHHSNCFHPLDAVSPLFDTDGNTYVIRCKGINENGARCGRQLMNGLACVIQDTHGRFWSYCGKHWNKFCITMNYNKNISKCANKTAIDLDIPVESIDRTNIINLLNLHPADYHANDVIINQSDSESDSDEEIDHDSDQDFGDDSDDNSNDDSTDDDKDESEEESEKESEEESDEESEKESDEESEKESEKELEEESEEVPLIRKNIREVVKKRKRDSEEEITERKQQRLIEAEKQLEKAIKKSEDSKKETQKICKRVDNLIKRASKYLSPRYNDSIIDLTEEDDE